MPSDIARPMRVMVAVLTLDKGKFEPALDSLVNTISKKFSIAFDRKSVHEFRPKKGIQADGRRKQLFRRCETRQG